MTSRSDLPRLGASLGLWGTLLERDGQTAHDRMYGWQFGPRKAPALAADDVCRCGHSIESHVDGHDVCRFSTDDLNEPSASGTPEFLCWCERFEAAPQGAPSEDRKTEQKQRARAAEHFDEWMADLNALDDLAQRLLRKIDIAVPPNPEEVKNRRTGEFEPWTPAEVVAAGWCAPCWSADQTFTAIPLDRKGHKRYRDACGFCGPFRAAHGIDPPAELLELRHAGRNLSQQVVDDAVSRAKAKQQPKGKKGKRKKGKVAA